MITLQEWLNEKYPTKGEREKVEEINIKKISEKRGELEGGELDLSEYVGLKKVYICGAYLAKELTKLNVSNCNKLVYLDCSHNIIKNFGKLFFPKTLEKLSVADNQTSPIDIEIFSKLINLKELKIGTQAYYAKIRRNKFYGSFKSWANMTKLELFCIEATDVNEGLEYLSTNFYKSKQRKDYVAMQTSPHGTDAKCVAIQNELRPFNYDLLAWQLAHPEKMLISHPEYFTNPNSKEQWLTALNNKIKESQATLSYIAENEVNKLSKIARLKTKIKLLKEIQAQLNQQIEEEREIHTETMKNMDNWYRQLPPTNPNLKNILANFAREYLALNQENQVFQQEIKELKGTIAVMHKLVEPATQEQGTQTELTNQELEQQQKEIQELKQKIPQLENNQSQQQTKVRTENPPKNN